MATANRSEYLTIGSVILGTAAAWVTNMEVLYNAEQRGRNRLVPGTAGVVANPRRLDVVTHDLNVVISGFYDSDGVAASNAHQQLRDNIDEIKTITAPVTTGDGTRSVTWTLPDASTLTADCQFGALQITERISKYIVQAQIELTVPAGEFT